MELGLLQDLVAQWFPKLLTLYWLLAAGSVVVTVLPIPVPQAFKDAVVLSASRGKLWHDKPSALGVLKDWSVPQAWFLHFYVLGSCCNAAVLIAYTLSVGSAAWTAAAAEPFLLLCLFQLHLIRRACETKFMLRYNPDYVMHGIAYVFGMSYYVVVPLSLLSASWYQQQQWKELPHQPLAAAAGHAAHTLSTQLKGLPAQLNRVQRLGAAVFLAGNVLQFASHWSLAQLSKQRPGYSIPSGGLFELVSCPHYFAEIVIYLGLLVASQGQLMPFLMLVWVGVNLVLAAAATHKWYRRRFKAYPLARKALVPLVW